MTEKPENGALTKTPVATPLWLNTKVIDAVEVSVEAYLGAARMTIAELSALGTGSVVVLDAALNAEVELRLNGVPIGRGELVAVGDNFAVRINELSS